jgi:hypothetical protein
MKNICVLYITSAFLLHSEVIQSDKHYYLCKTNSRTRKMIQVNLSLRYSNIKVTVTCKLQSAHVEKECVRLDSGGKCVTDSSTGTIRQVWGKGVLITLTLHVTGFWNMTPHTVAQIYRRFVGNC